MGQGLSCTGSDRRSGLIGAVQDGDLELVKAAVELDPSLLEQTFGNERLSALHLAASRGQIEVLSLLLDLSVNPDIVSRHKQTPLMLAAMHGKVTCVEKLISAGANILKFDSLQERTCLHYAAYSGQSDCLKVILSSAHSSHVAASWGFARFVNIKDGSGLTPLHLAAQRGQAECVHVLLDKGALVCASTGGHGYFGSTPLHLAARGGSLECVRALLAWGAERVVRDASGSIPYMVALKYKHGRCAALLNPSSAAPLVWPAPFKFISELDPEAKALLEKALVEANMEREKAILDAVYSLPSSLDSESEANDDTSEVSNYELCCICFEQVCTIEVQKCCHQMCAHCTLALCSHNKPNPSAIANAAKAPVCPFCRSSITRLVVAKNILKNDSDSVNVSPSMPKRSRKSWHSSEGSNSFKGLSSAMSSFGRRSGKIAAECNMELEKLDE